MSLTFFLSPSVSLTLSLEAAPDNDKEAWGQGCSDHGNKPK